MTDIDEKRFDEAVRLSTERERQSKKVGTLSEKLIHRTLKYYFEPDDEKHEIEVCGSVVDIKNDDGICEIQTRSFDRLVPKLEKLLDEYSVNVIYPIVVEKTVYWTDRENGEVSSTRKSSKKGRVTDVFPELYYLTELLQNKRFKLTLVLLLADEYRILDGYGKDKKKRATKVNIIPTKLLEILEFSDFKELNDYIIRILPDNFTVKQLNSILCLRPKRLSLALKFLLKIGAIEQIGKSGKAYLYGKKK